MSSHTVTTEAIEAVEVTEAVEKTKKGTPRVKKPRRPAGPREVFAVVQVLDENGNALKLPRAAVKVISFEKNATAVLDIIDSGQYDHALYLRGTITGGK